MNAQHSPVIALTSGSAQRSSTASTIRSITDTTADAATAAAAWHPTSGPLSSARSSRLSVGLSDRSPVRPLGDSADARLAAPP
eukprot:CAMPEP_0204354778 /NCGR_PEP_ID=MMETSP0469-20131031/33653_1 /ASSEMBLY_ACC=CAM_ASM_000384 /TAXON_ID=2969 /ORGANISM="Oxyrrhis marina" /LENGTH=82 /DNA_ID=CAMNT_0051341931 /DNA_START=188 /DNA_END=437 /DNA_ORIENTATION=+